MAYPKIVYDPLENSVESTLLFTYPPVQKPVAPELVAQRFDSITVSGLKQSIFERTDDFTTLQMDFVPFGDLDDWIAFMRYALTGGVFYYYPDADLSSFTAYTLEDTTWPPKLNFKGITKFSLRMRVAVGDDFSTVFGTGGGTGSDMNFAENEVPAGTVDGVNAIFTLAHDPNPNDSLELFKNGQLLTPGSDYVLVGTTITYSVGIPQVGDIQLAFYRY